MAEAWPMFLLCCGLNNTLLNQSICNTELHDKVQYKKGDMKTLISEQVHSCSITTLIEAIAIWDSFLKSLLKYRQQLHFTFLQQR